MGWDKIVDITPRKAVGQAGNKECSESRQNPEENFQNAVQTQDIVVCGMKKFLTCVAENLIFAYNNYGKWEHFAIKKEKGDGAMSAVTQNFVYSFGKKQSGKQENTISSEKLKEMKNSLAKFLSEKK